MYTENWVKIPSYPEYEVSNIGNVRSYKNKIIKKQSLSSNGKYYFVVVSKDKKQKKISVHRLMMWAFIGIQGKGIEVRHKNGNGLDNKIENLCYGTKSENMQDAIKHGTFSMSSWHPCSKLSTKDIQEIYLSNDHYKEW